MLNSLAIISQKSEYVYTERERQQQDWQTEENKMLNRKFEGAMLFEIDFTPKGTKEMKTVKVWAKNRLDASNYMILNHLWGRQHEIRVAAVNLMK